MQDIKKKKEEKAFYIDEYKDPEKSFGLLPGLKEADFLYLC